MEWRIQRHGAIDSTSERAFAALAEGVACHGDVHVAQSQSAGRGRLGRRWESAPGAGLYLSAVLRPPAPSPPPPAWTLAGGLGALEGAERLGLVGARLDWPNDLVVGSSKLGGVLVESRALDLAAPAYVLGIGLNVLQTSFPEPLALERPVTSLALEGVATDPEAALRAVLTALGPRLEQALARDPALGADFLARTGLAEARVRILVGTRPLEGRLLELDAARGLVLQTRNSELVLPLAHVSSVEALA